MNLSDRPTRTAGDRTPRSLRPNRSLIAFFAGSAVAFSSCSSNGDATPITTNPPLSAVVTDTQPPPTEPPTTDTAIATDPTTTQAPTTTAAPTSENTEAPAPTVQPGVDLTQELEAAVARLDEAWVSCFGQAPACDVSGLATVFAGDQLAANAAIATRANTNGWTVSNLDSYRTQLEGVQFLDNDRKAIATTCNEDGLVVSDSDGIVINDRFSSRRTEWTFELLNDDWRITTGIELESAVGEGDSLCSFS